MLAHCWAHARGKLREVFERDGSDIAAEGLRRIAEFYRIEAAIRGRPAEERRAVRQARTVPLVEDFGLWLEDCRARYAVFQMAEAALPSAVFAGLLGLINGLRGPPSTAVPA